MTLAGSPSRPLSSSSRGAHQLCLSSNSPMTKRVSIPYWKNVSPLYSDKGRPAFRSFVGLVEFCAACGPFPIDRRCMVFAFSRWVFVELCARRG